MKPAMAFTMSLVLAVVAAAGGYYYARHAGHPSVDTAQAAPEAGRKVLYWFDPMYPQHRFDKPGKSPFMDMQLVPKYADEAAEAGTITINPQTVQNLGVRMAEGVRGSLSLAFDAVGSVAYNERGVVQLQARSAGFVERLHARAPLDPVAKGAPLVELLYADWAGAQEEYLFLRRQQSPEMTQLALAARQRLLLLGMTERDIEAVEREGRTRTRTTITSPISGVIAELGVREGMTVTPGASLFRIVDLSTVWVNAELPETQAGWIRPEAPVEARVAAYPGEVFKGKVGAILPEVSAATRTVRARIELRNPGARLKPGMFANLRFSDQKGRDAILVPSEAVIRRGSGNVVIVPLEEGKFRVAEVQTGAEAAGKTEITKGLQPGDKVVVSGQFLIDSEASLSGALSRLESAGAKPAAQSGLHTSRGVITDIDPNAGEVELDHDPIPALQWPRMTMSFTVEKPESLRGLKKGDAVEFDLSAKPAPDGSYVIRRIEPRGAK
ncbi:MAG TPA: efflux RND transporter periplasmic adaptor subunit [Burkholderiales bacterium]|nr:efflux RND transporter periplasmic adaptor subunit [Burkholderiales bacterium]